MIALGFTAGAVGVGAAVVVAADAGAAPSGPGISVSGLAGVSSIDLGPDRTAYALPADWFGVGFNDPEAPVNDPAETGSFEQVLSLLEINDDGPLVLRIGGETSDQTGIFRINGRLGLCSGVGNEGGTMAANTSTTATSQYSPVIDARTPQGQALGTAMVSNLESVAADTTTTAPVRVMLDANFPDAYNGPNGPVRTACLPPAGITKQVAPIGQNDGYALSKDLSDAIAAGTKTTPPQGQPETSALYGWELGNEPDLNIERKSGGPYNGVHPLDMVDALREFVRNVFTTKDDYPALVAAGALACPSTTQAAKTPCSIDNPGGGQQWWQTFDNKNVEEFHGGGMLYTGHTYGPGLKVTAAHPQPPASDLLPESFVDSTIDKISTPATWIKQELGGTYRVDEFNSNTSGGYRGASNSFASALFITDALFSMLNQTGKPEGTDVPGEIGNAVLAHIPTGVPIGVNVHVRNDPDSGAGAIDSADRDLANAPFAILGTYQSVLNDQVITPTGTTDGWPNDGLVVPRPELYGMVMFSCAIDAQSQICNPAGAVSGAVGQFIPLSYDQGQTITTASGATKHNPSGRPNTGALKMWAVRADSKTGSELRLLFINKGGAAQTPTINTSGTSNVSYTILTNADNVLDQGDPANTDQSTVDFRGGPGTNPVEIGGAGALVNPPSTTPLTPQALPFGTIAPNANGSVSVRVPGYSEELVILKY